MSESRLSPLSALSSIFSDLDLPMNNQEELKEPQQELPQKSQKEIPQNESKELPHELSQKQLSFQNNSSNSFQNNSAEQLPQSSSNNSQRNLSQRNFPQNLPQHLLPFPFKPIKIHLSKELLRNIQSTSPQEELSQKEQLPQQSSQEEHSQEQILQEFSQQLPQQSSQDPLRESSHETSEIKKQLPRQRPRRPTQTAKPPKPNLPTDASAIDADLAAIREALRLVESRPRSSARLSTLPAQSDFVLPNVSPIVSSPQSKSAPTVQSQDNCSACLGKGKLLCCDTCPRVFHLCCVREGFSDASIPDGSWQCRECRFKKKTSAQRLLKKRHLESPGILSPAIDVDSFNRNSNQNGIMDPLIQLVDSINPRAFRLPPYIRYMYTGVWTHPVDGSYMDMRHCAMDFGVVPCSNNVVKRRNEEDDDEDDRFSKKVVVNGVKVDSSTVHTQSSMPKTTSSSFGESTSTNRLSRLLRDVPVCYRCKLSGLRLHPMHILYSPSMDQPQNSGSHRLRIQTTRSELVKCDYCDLYFHVDCAGGCGGSSVGEICAENKDAIVDVGEWNFVKRQVWNGSHVMDQVDLMMCDPLENANQHSYKISSEMRRLGVLFPDDLYLWYIDPGIVSGAKWIRMRSKWMCPCHVDWTVRGLVESGDGFGCMGRQKMKCWFRRRRGDADGNFGFDGFETFENSWLKIHSQKRISRPVVHISESNQADESFVDVCRIVKSESSAMNVCMHVYSSKPTNPQQVFVDSSTQTDEEIISENNRQIDISIQDDEESELSDHSSVSNGTHDSLFCDDDTKKMFSWRRFRFRRHARQLARAGRSHRIRPSIGGGDLIVPATHFNHIMSTNNSTTGNPSTTHFQFDLATNALFESIERARMRGDMDAVVELCQTEVVVAESKIVSGLVEKVCEKDAVIALMSMRGK